MPLLVSVSVSSLDKLFSEIETVGCRVPERNSDEEGVWVLLRVADLRDGLTSPLEVWEDVGESSLNLRETL